MPDQITHFNKLKGLGDPFLQSQCGKRKFIKYAIPTKTNMMAITLKLSKCSADVDRKNCPLNVEKKTYEAGDFSFGDFPLQDNDTNNNASPTPDDPCKGNAQLLHHNHNRGTENTGGPQGSSSVVFSSCNPESNDNRGYAATPETFHVDITKITPLPTSCMSQNIRRSTMINTRGNSSNLNSPLDDDWRIYAARSPATERCGQWFEDFKKEEVLRRHIRAEYCDAVIYPLEKERNFQMSIEDTAYKDRYFIGQCGRIKLMSPIPCVPISPETPRLSPAVHNKKMTRREKSDGNIKPKNSSCKHHGTKSLEAITKEQLPPLKCTRNKAIVSLPKTNIHEDFVRQKCQKPQTSRKELVTSSDSITLETLEEVRRLDQRSRQAHRRRKKVHENRKTINLPDLQINVCKKENRLKNVQDISVDCTCKQKQQTISQKKKFSRDFKLLMINQRKAMNTEKRKSESRHVRSAKGVAHMLYQDMWENISKLTDNLVPRPPSKLNRTKVPSLVINGTSAVNEGCIPDVMVSKPFIGTSKKVKSQRHSSVDGHLKVLISHHVDVHFE